jgi:hypothetical protein
MAETRPPLAAFEDAVFESVASDTGQNADDLRKQVRRHQEHVRDLPGVDDIVYEWRNHFHLDPLVHRTDEVYVLALPEHVWDEFADPLDVTPDNLRTLKTVHDRQARTLVTDTDRLEDDAALVLTRP